MNDAVKILLAVFALLLLAAILWLFAVRPPNNHVNEMNQAENPITESHPFYQLLATKYDEDREDEAIEILNAHPEIATMIWTGPDEQGQPFVRDSTALHYAANDGKLRLMKRLIELGADVNADQANWYRSVLSWAANNARVDAVKLLLDAGADPRSLNALHAAAFGGSSCGEEDGPEYVETLRTLLDAGADLNDKRYHDEWTALDSGNEAAVQFLRSRGAEE